MKDYYRILGVLDDAEDIIIRASYKALAQVKNQKSYCYSINANDSKNQCLAVVK